MAPSFLDWLNYSPNLSWLDLGCGTGALSEAIIKHCQPAHLTCTDPSPEFLKKAEERLAGKADFAVGNAMAIPGNAESFDVIVSGLALNFFSNVPTAITEMKRVVTPNGIIAAYVWDYADRMDFLRIFWDTACELNPEACKFHEGVRFSICNASRLEAAFIEAGLVDVYTANLDINTIFKDFDDYWQPFMGGQGPAPGYVASLTDNEREALKEALYEKLNLQIDGRIKLLARAIAVKGMKKL